MKKLTNASIGDKQQARNVNTPLNKSKPQGLTLRILRLLEQGMYPAEIARKLKVSRARVSQCMKNLRNSGYIHEKYRSRYQIIELREKGKTALELQRVNNLSSGARAMQLVMGSTSTGDAPVDIHHIQLKLPILKDAEVPWEEHEFKNWKPKFKRVPVLGANFQKNTDKSITVNLYAKKCDSPNGIYRIITTYAMLASAYLRDSYGIEVDLTTFSVPSVEYHMPDPGAEEIVNKGLKPSFALGRAREKIGPNDPEQPAQVWADNTPFTGRETNDLVHAQRYMMMPETVDGIMNAMMSMKESMTYMAENEVSHVDLIKTITLLLKKLSMDHAKARLNPLIKRKLAGQAVLGEFV